MTRSPVSAQQKNRDEPRKITGRQVLIGLIAFFGFVTLVNVVMISAAISTFGGLETRSSYQAGIEFRAEALRAREQDALEWSVDVGIDGDRQRRLVSIEVTDSSGAPISDLSVTVILEHPVDERRDRQLDLAMTGSGIYSGEIPVPDGAWSLRLDLNRGEALVFRSHNQVALK